MNTFVRASAILAAMSAMPLTAFAQSEVVVWVAGEPGQTNVYDDLAAAYSAQNADVTVTVVKNSSDLFNPALIPALSAGEGPDLFSFGTGPGQPAALSLRPGQATDPALRHAARREACDRQDPAAELLRERGGGALEPR